MTAACLDCGLPYAAFPLDTVLSDAQWRLIHPDDGGVLCAGCIVTRAARLPGVIVVSARIIFAADHGDWVRALREDAGNT